MGEVGVYFGDADLPHFGNSKISVATNGMVTVARGLKKDKTYKVTVMATSAATTNYKSATVKGITLTAKVN